MKIFTRMKNAKVCLLCTGSELKPNLSTEKYDFVCGVNRIYQTNFASRLDCIFHNASAYDLASNMMEQLRSINKECEIVLVPSVSRAKPECLAEIDLCVMYDPKCYCLPGLMQIQEKTVGFCIFSGLSALSLIMNAEPYSVDVYGMDMYSGSKIYTENSKGQHLPEVGPKGSRKKHHDHKKNYNYLKKMLKQHQNINWVVADETREKLDKLYK